MARASLASAPRIAPVKRLRVLHVFGSSTSAYYSDLSTNYAAESIAATLGATADRFEFVFARVHPRGDCSVAAALGGGAAGSVGAGPTWSFPTAMDDEALALAALVPEAGGSRCGHSVGLARLAQGGDLRCDVVVPHMFCFEGMTSYRALLDLLEVRDVDRVEVRITRGYSQREQRGRNVPAGEGGSCAV